MSQLANLQDVLVDMLKDTLDAEQQLVEALPKMAAAAKSAELKKAIRNHLSETKGHVQRLEEAFEVLGMKPKTKKCKAMAGLIKEGDEAGKEEGRPALVDACIIAAAQKVEHYEISAYGTMRAHAKLLAMDELVQLFDETLSEEKAADEGLTEICEPLLARVVRAPARSGV